MASIVDVIHHQASDISEPSLAGPFGSGKNSRSPVSRESREDRIRSVFGVRSGGGLPPVNRATLLAYYKHLRARLSIPFQAEFCPAHSRVVRQVTVMDLLSPTGPDADSSRGLECLARGRDGVLRVPLVDLEVREDDPNFHLIEDYWYWAWNWGIERSQDGLPIRPA